MVVYLHRYNQLSSIPASLANCTKIDEFNIEGNNVSELPVSTFFFRLFFHICKSCALLLISQHQAFFPLYFTVILFWSHCHIQNYSTSSVILNVVISSDINFNAIEVEKIIIIFFVFLKDNLLHCLKMLNNVTLSRNNFEHFPTGPPKQFASVQVQDYIVVVIY